jgi:hypothetical protein
MKVDDVVDGFVDLNEANAHRPALLLPLRATRTKKRKKKSRKKKATPAAAQQASRPNSWRS